MKKLLTILLGAALTFGSVAVNAQSLETQADVLTKEMATKIDLNEKDYLNLKKANFNRLAKIQALSSLREQDHRYLDLRLDLIEEEYQETVYKMLKPAQYTAFLNYKNEQPFTYAAVLSQTQQNQLKAIAIETE